MVTEPIISRRLWCQYILSWGGSARRRNATFWSTFSKKCNKRLFWPVFSNCFFGQIVLCERNPPPPPLDKIIDPPLIEINRYFRSRQNSLLKSFLSEDALKFGSQKVLRKGFFLLKKRLKHFSSNGLQTFLFKILKADRKGSIIAE